MDLEMVEVVAEAVTAHLLHPLADPALDAGALVAREVEATIALDEVQQRLEADLGRRGHSTASCPLGVSAV
jgi:hypothetical protein